MTGRVSLFLLVSVVLIGVIALSVPPPKQEPKMPVPLDGSVPVSAP